MDLLKKPHFYCENRNSQDGGIQEFDRKNAWSRNRVKDGTVPQHHEWVLLGRQYFSCSGRGRFFITFEQRKEENNLSYR